MTHPELTQLTDERRTPMLDSYQQNRRDEFIAGIRGLIEWMESHPDMPAPSSMDTGNIFTWSKEELTRLRRDCGLHDKMFSEYFAGFEHKFSNEVKLHLVIERDKVCRRVRVGEKVIPASPETVVPAKEETIEPLYEWKCDDALLADSDATQEPEPQLNGAT